MGRLQRIITSMNVSSLDVNCSGNGITSALSFQANTALHVGDAALSLKIHTLDAGISTSNDINLEKITVTVAAPLSGYVDCGIMAHNITITVGQPSVTDFDLDVDLQLDKALQTIAAVVCADLPFCKDAIKSKLSSTI